jgi:hypothetical protein
MSSTVVVVDESDDDDLTLLQAQFPHTDAAALRLVLDECDGDVQRSVALINQLLARQHSAPRSTLYRVLYSWVARSIRELSVVRGDVVVATHSKAASDWPWLAVYSVQRDDVAIDATSSSSSSSSSSLRYVPFVCVRPLNADIGAVALRDYVCAEDKVGHLSFRRDDRLILLSRIPGYDWWYALHRGAGAAAAAAAAGPVGRVPITLLRVDANADVFAAEAERTAVPVMPTIEPPMICGGTEDDAMADALSDLDDENDDLSDDPLFCNETFVQAEQLRRQTLLEADDASVDEAARELTEWAAKLRRESQDDLSTSSSSSSISSSRGDSLWLNATQSAAARNGLARMQ